MNQDGEGAPDHTDSIKTLFTTTDRIREDVATILAVQRTTSKQVAGIDSLLRGNGTRPGLVSEVAVLSERGGNCKREREAFEKGAAAHIAADGLHGKFTTGQIIAGAILFLSGGAAFVAILSFLF